MYNKSVAQKSHPSICRYVSRLRSSYEWVFFPLLFFNDFHSRIPTPLAAAASRCARLVPHHWRTRFTIDAKREEHLNSSPCERNHLSKPHHTHVWIFIWIFLPFSLFIRFEFESQTTNPHGRIHKPNERMEFLKK